MATEVGDLSNTGSLVSKNLLFGFAFGGLAISFLFIVFRTVVRWRLFGRLFWDDALVAIAWLPFLVTTLVYWTQREGLFMLWYLTHGIKPLTQHNIDLLITQFRLLTTALVVFTTSLWAIKLSFLLFFRRLGARQYSQRIWWWIVTGFTIASCIALVGAVPYQCSTSSNLTILIERCGGPGLDYYQLVLYYCHLAADIATDILIISIPVIMFWKVQIPLKQKLGLIAIFSMTILVILCAIIRIAVTSRQHGSVQDFMWLVFWASLELNMAIIVACCGAFRQLFKNASKSETGGSHSKDVKLSAIHSRPTGWQSSLRDNTQRSITHAAPRYHPIESQDGTEAEWRILEKPLPIVPIVHEV